MSIQAFVKNTSNQSESTAHLYNLRLKKFEAFVNLEYKSNVDKITNIIANGQDVYTIFNKYVHYLK